MKPLALDNVEEQFCSDWLKEQIRELFLTNLQLRELLQGLLECSRERADDWVFGEVGYYHWARKTEQLLGSKK